MGSRNRGFDPLSSLFEAPDPARGVPLPELDEGDAAEPGPKVEMTDPLFKRPVAPADTESVDVSLDESPEELARRLAREALAAAADSEDAAEGADAAQGADAAGLSADVLPTAEDPVALAKRLATEALARAQAEEPAGAAAESSDKAALARKLAQEALRKAQGREPAAVAEPTPAPSDKAALARKLAADAAARVAKAHPPSKATRAKARQSRVSALTERARKPQSALEAARAAAQAEEERQAQALRKKVDQLRDVVQDLIPAWLPGIGTVYVANAIAVDKRDVLRTLWKAHRSKFLSDGQLERAVGAAAVLSALDQIPDGLLVAAHAVTDASDYLVWLDLDKRALVAAFSDARAYFAG